MTITPVQLLQRAGVVAQSARWFASTLRDRADRTSGRLP
jgi:hypothetical protein